MVFEDLFNQSEGREIHYNGMNLTLMYKLQLASTKTRLKFRFCCVNSHWKQGVIIKTKGDIEVNNRSGNKMIFWEESSPKEFDILVSTESKELIVYNVWDTGNGVIQHWHNGAAIHVEQNKDHFRFNCNDGYPDDDMDDLIFEIEVV